MINKRRIFLFSLMVCLMISCKKNNDTGSAPPVTPPVVNPVDTLNGWTKTQINRGPTYDVVFQDQLQGLLIYNNIIGSTTDGGATWTDLPTAIFNAAFVFQFADAQHGYTVGYNILQTSADGGATWSKKTLPSGSAIGLQFVNTSAGFYNDNKQGLYKSTNGGTSWNKILDGTGCMPFFFFDDLHGNVVLNDSFRTTHDGGLSWNYISTVKNTPDYYNGFYGMQFLDTLTGYYGSTDGLFKTVDGGKTWIKSLDVSNNSMKPHFFDANNGYCFTYNAIYLTEDGGQHWFISCKLADDLIFGCFFLDMHTAWACTNTGFLLRLKP